MDLGQERLRAEAEDIRQQQELAREATERARVIAEDARVVAEDERLAAAIEVKETVAMLTTLLQRMEAVEALRRAGRTKPESH